jgi:PAS domain S-box-containing protein
MRKFTETLRIARLKPKTVIIISVFIFLVMALSAFYEVRQSKKEIYHLLAQNAASLIETISLSSHNTLNASYEIEDVIAERLLDNARLIKNLDSIKTLNTNDLKKLGRENNLYRIILVGNEKNSIISSDQPGEETHSIEELTEQIAPILNGNELEMVLGMQKVNNKNEQRYAVAVARSFGRGAVVIYLDADDFLNFRKKIGIGKLIQQIGKNQGIEYVILQDTIGILAACSAIDSIGSVKADTFLTGAYKNDNSKMRLFDFKGKTVFEVVKRLFHDDEVVGIFRIGLSLDELRESEERTTRRIIILSIALGLFTIVVLSIIVTSQNLNLVTKEYSKFKSFTGSILQNMGEAVIVVNNKFEILLLNNYAGNLFGKSAEEVAGRQAMEIFPAEFEKIIKEISLNGFSAGDFETVCKYGITYKYFSVNVTRNLDSRGETDGYSFVIRDLTEKKHLQELSSRNEKLSAMGELASGVAHEIRNPINSIGMIAQRLAKEFTPRNEEEEYSHIIGVLRNEVGRVNNIVTQFLNYSKPLELSFKEVSFGEFIKKAADLFSCRLKDKDAALEIKPAADVKIKIDSELMTQALLNLFQNAYDALDRRGKIEIEYFADDVNLVVNISDNGAGIPEDKQKRIFNLYYTSKKDGNGLGLSITQKIVNQHNGEISFTSVEKKGSVFTIKLPLV